MPRPILAKIDLAALEHNVGQIKALAPSAQILAVLKANAYGHGIKRIAHVLSKAGVPGFALLEIDAAIRLRESGFTQRIVLLEGFFSIDELPLMEHYELEPVIHSVDQVRMLMTHKSRDIKHMWIKLNTGMNRLGLTHSQLREVEPLLHTYSDQCTFTWMSHFSQADQLKGVDWQLEKFNQLIGCSANPLASRWPKSLANSAAVLRYPQTHFEWIRPGLMLYGSSPFLDQSAHELKLRPVMSLTSQVIAIQDLQAGDQVGYGGLYEATGCERVGIVACGYADGYPRHALTGTPVKVAHTMTRTLGRVSMDMLCVDLTGIPDAGVGAQVVLWGEGNSIDAVAASAGTVSYELMCALSARVSGFESVDL